MKVLITGIAGATGHYLAEYIRAEHPAVAVFGKPRSEMNLRDRRGVEAELAAIQPDRIFHLASTAILPQSFQRPTAFYENNIIGTSNLFEAARLQCPQARILMVSSCEVYGDPFVIPVREDHPFQPLSPYAISKAAQEHMAQMYYRVYELQIVTSRLFNVINPRRADLFSSSFAHQIAAIEAGKLDNIKVGNLDSARTLLDVRDVVRGYWDLLELGQPGEAYNIGAEQEIGVGDMLDTMIGMARCPIPVVHDPALIRPIDIRSQIADSAKFKAVTGWKPRYSLADSLEWLLDYMRGYYK